MAASKAADVNQETAGGDAAAVAAAAGDVGRRHVEPCVWGDFFATYTPPPSQRSEEWMRERADQLKGQVRQMFVGDDDKAMTIADTVILVDTLERLGIDRHFHEEIDAALSRIHSEGQEFDGSDDPHIVALRFCLLKQHGFWVSADVFNKFRDGTGSLSIDLTTDLKGLLSLYNAAHMAIPGEAALDDIIAFTRHHLEAAKGKLGSPMVNQVSRALEIPRPRFMRRLEAFHYITEYEQVEGHNSAMLELARVDFNTVMSLHHKELKNLTLWWMELYDDVKLTYARDCVVEAYFFSCGSIYEEENSRARIIFTKMFLFVGLMDDTYDSHATLEECQIFNEAVQRWDESMVPILPQYLRMLYIKILSNFSDIENILEPWEKYRMASIHKMFKLQSENYLKEAEWFNRNCIPSFKEHVDVSVMSTGLPILFVMALMGMSQRVTKDAFDWALDVPDMIRGCAEIGRFLNDIASYKLGKSKSDVASSLECYMKEHGMAVEDAMADLGMMVEQAWRRINQSCMELDRGILPAAQLAVNMTRMLEVYYLHGRDGFTYGRELKELITFLFLKQLPV